MCSAWIYAEKKKIVSGFCLMMAFERLKAPGSWDSSHRTSQLQSKNPEGLGAACTATPASALTSESWEVVKHSLWSLKDVYFLSSLELTLAHLSLFPNLCS